MSTKEGLAIRHEREKRRRLSETEEEREQRLALRRERDKLRRLSETADEREQRLQSMSNQAYFYLSLLARAPIYGHEQLYYHLLPAH